MDKAKEWAGCGAKAKGPEELIVEGIRQNIFSYECGSFILDGEFTQIINNCLVDQLSNERDQLLAERDRPREVLSEIEWNGPRVCHPVSQTYHIACPSCGNPKEIGHHNWCRLAALIKEKEPTP